MPIRFDLLSLFRPNRIKRSKIYTMQMGRKSSGKTRSRKTALNEWGGRQLHVPFDRKTLDLITRLTRNTFTNPPKIVAECQYGGRRGTNSYFMPRPGAPTTRDWWIARHVTAMLPTYYSYHGDILTCLLLLLLLSEHTSIFNNINNCSAFKFHVVPSVVYFYSNNNAIS